MEEKDNFTQADSAPGNDSDTSPRNMIGPDEDGRSKEWQDRARVNLEQVPEGTKTILERDFEPETPDSEQAGNASAGANTPAY